MLLSGVSSGGELILIIKIPRLDGLAPGDFLIIKRDLQMKVSFLFCVPKFVS